MAKQRNAAALEALGPAPAGVKQTELQYTTTDGTKLRAKLYQPDSPPKDGSPLIVLFHGGGFCVGTLEGEEQTARNFVQAFGATCISAQYRLAPEFKFPYAILDAFDALKWAASNAQSWGADASTGFVVGGTSAGGNISAVLALMARDEELSPPLTGQYLAIPAVAPNKEKVPDKYKEYYLSMEQNKDAPVLPKPAIDMFMKGYSPDENDWRYGPILDPQGHKNLPAALFQIDGLDPLRDEALIYDDILQSQGTKTKVYLYPGLPHGHWGFFPFLKSADKFRREQVEGMGWLLGRTPDMAKAKLSAEVASV
jgi:acetyl esterase/lipase